MNRPKMIGAMKRRLPGGFTNSRRQTNHTGYQHAKATREAADQALQRLTKRGSL